MPAHAFGQVLGHVWDTYSTDCSGHFRTRSGHVHGRFRTRSAGFWGHVHGHVHGHVADMFEYDILKFFFAFFDAIVKFGKCDW